MSEMNRGKGGGKAADKGQRRASTGGGGFRRRRVCKFRTEKIDYIDLIRAVREACGARTPIMRIPYSAFWALLRIYGLFDRDPPFTTTQLEALVTPDVFEVIDWPGIFGVKATPLKTALAETYRHAVYSQIVLEF